MDVYLEATRPRRRFTVKEYYRLAEFGILDRDSRVELIEGDIIEMPPIGPPHASAVNELARILNAKVGEKAKVTVQSPILLGESTHPQPDVCLVKPVDVYFHRHPEPEEVLLIIEVSDSSVEFDRSTKGRLYSRAWIPEYWLIDIPGQRVEVYSSPGPDGYTEKQELGRGDRISPAAVPDVEIDTADILGTPPSH